ncbi:hypothetical protein CUMW_026380 [Citrus unshiu]|nr:hypothetical protein CUMW_026380 [Citrus unshiu]
MDYEPYDSSGTDDDLPPSHQNRIPRGGRIAGNGRPPVGSVPYPRMHGDADMETQIHQLEQEAYSSWRQAGGLQPGMHSIGQGVHDPIPSPTVSASHKRQKITQSVPSQSFGGPSPSFHPQPVTTSHQPSSSAAKRGPATGSKGKKHKPGLPGVPSMKSMQYPSSGPAGRGQVANRASSGAALVSEPPDGATFDPLIGKRVRTRWPDDNNFYEAVITDYNPVEGRHALVYDIGTVNETWEWVNLSEISPEDIQWEGEDPGVSRRGGYGGSGHGMNRPVGRDNVPGAGRGRGVERVFGANHPDPVEIEKAKRVLKEQEQALIDAISRLADISDGESGTSLSFLYHL